MGDLAAKMAGERNNVSVHFMKFMNIVSKNPRATICFFEGEDRKYYVTRLDLAGDNFCWAGIDCNGKKNVLALYELIATHDTYKNALVAFFVDRDFDEPIPQEIRSVVYETPCYSIENLYCTDHCIQRVLSIEFKLENDPVRVNLLTDVHNHFSL